MVIRIIIHRITRYFYLFYKNENMCSEKLNLQIAFRIIVQLIRHSRFVLSATLIITAVSLNASGQTEQAKVEVPDWALPGSPIHKQVPPPADFHRAPRTDNTPIGIFDGQTDVGAALVPGSSGYNDVTKQYTIVSAGYNVWYQRDEFRFVWKKMSGDISLATDVYFPDAEGYGDRKAFVIIRQSLEDDSKEVVVALHGAGLLHLAWRPGKGQMMKEIRINNRKELPDLVSGHVNRIGIEKKGDTFALFVSSNGEPIRQLGDPVDLHIEEPFYVGIGFCSHLPAKTDTAVLSHVSLKNAASMMSNH
jgi:hypothetical protein